MSKNCGEPIQLDLLALILLDHSLSTKLYIGGMTRSKVTRIITDELKNVRRNSVENFSKKNSHLDWRKEFSIFLAISLKKLPH